jgi:hypothetical protein
MKYLGSKKSSIQISLENKEKLKTLKRELKANSLSDIIEAFMIFSEKNKLNERILTICQKQFKKQRALTTMEMKYSLLFKLKEFSNKLRVLVYNDAVESILILLEKDKKIKSSFEEYFTNNFNTKTN